MTADENQQQFREQGGAATMDPSALRRWLTSKMMSHLANPETPKKLRIKAERKRQKLGLPHTVEYFHQVDDGYSHLAVQVLENLSQRYNVQVVCHLVSEAKKENLPEPDLLTQLSIYDSCLIAPFYDLEPPGDETSIAANWAERATRILAGLSNDDFIAHAAKISSAMWQRDDVLLAQLAEHFGSASNAETREKISAGNMRRETLKHYSGAMFYYGDEWYWGIDRLYHLEQRLAELGLDTTPDQPLIAPRKEESSGPLMDDGQLTLEVFPSFRSPYTAISFDRTVALAEATGVTLKVRPVLPMVMRGVPATMEKGRYILSDTAREARAAGVAFGPCFDPIGEPTRRAYSLYPWADEQGKGVEYFSAFLQCAWTEAINTNSDKGLKTVVQRAGLDWSEAKGIVGNSEWQVLVEDNRQAMYDSGLWGVPSFRLLDSNGEILLALWGQDRLWHVAAEIQSYLRGSN